MSPATDAGSGAREVRRTRWPSARRFLRESLFLALLAAVPAAVVAWRNIEWRQEEPLAAGEVRAAEARAWGEAAIWVDTRASAAFARKHVPGARQLTIDQWDAQLPQFLDRWEPGKRVVVYGETGTDTTETVALRLRTELDIPEVWVLHGGIDAWRGEQ